MRSLKVFLVGMSAVTALAMACGGSTTNSGGGNEGDSGSSSGGTSGSSSGSMDATSSSSSGSSSGAGSSSGSSSGGAGDSGKLQCTTPKSCGTGNVCCATLTNGMVDSSMCVTGTTCPQGSDEVCNVMNPMCPAGEVCRTRGGGMVGVCRPPRDGGTTTDAAPDAASDAAAD